MSRTFRRKNIWGSCKLSWELHNWDCGGGYNTPHAPPYDPRSDEGKRRVARYHADAFTVRHDRPGPSWYRRMKVERPQRFEAHRQLRRYIKDTGFVVVLNTKDPLRWN